jgi:hypothetical protein
MICWEFKIKTPSNIDPAYRYCIENFGEQVQNGRMIWECKSVDSRATLFFIYDESCAVMFATAWMD